MARGKSVRLLASIPERYASDFMDRMDKRTVLGKAVVDRYSAVLADLGEQFRAGFTLASGDINDPTSTNQTLTGFYARKPVGIDLAFVEYKPGWLKSFSFIGGKFRDSRAQKVDPIPNPATGQTIASLPHSTKEEINEAVEAAKKKYATNPANTFASAGGQAAQ